MTALHKKLRRDLGRMKSQLFTISLVLACGVATIVAFGTTYLTLVAARDHFYAAYRFADVFADARNAPRSLAAAIREIPGVAAVDLRLHADVTIDLPGLDEPARAKLISLPEEQTLNRLHLLKGFLPRARNEVAASEAFAEANGLRPGDRFHAIINQRRTELVLAGLVQAPDYVYVVAPGAILPDERLYGVLWMQEQALGAALGQTGAFTQAALRLAPGANARAVRGRLDELLHGYGGAGAIDAADQVSNRLISDELAQQKGMATVVPVLFYAVAAFLLNIVVGRLVSVQRQQIALMKAFGYGNAAVIGHYLQLVSAIALAGSVLGIALGAWLGMAMVELYRDYFGFPNLAFQMPLWIPLLAAGLSVATAALVTVSTVRRIAALPPAEAMRPPAPAAYRPGLFDRWAARRLGPVAKMTARSLLRRPWRTAFAIVGISLSASIVILGGFWPDALDYMMDAQFSKADRSDFMVTFVGPLPPASLEELRRLPGAVNVEGIRFTGVKLHAGHRWTAASLAGVPPDAKLRRLLDKHAKPVDELPDGLLLSAPLAAKLGVKAGDRLWVESYEDTRAAEEMPVAGVANDMFGFSAYAPLEAVNRFLREGPRVSIAYLDLERPADPPFLRTVKALPGVLGVSSKAALIGGFNEVVAQQILVWVGVLIVLAFIICLGVVYNTLRVSLAERGWELSSMRILGFSRAEVTRMFLGEAVLETVFAIPLGLLAGYGMAALSLAALDTAGFVIPLIVAPKTYLLAAGAVAGGVLVSAWLVKRRIDRLDMVEVLKARE